MDNKILMPMGLAAIIVAVAAFFAACYCGGTPGVPGQNGTNGLIGPKGDNGDQGIPGENGRSITGPQGSSGSNGATGATGANGATGPQGEPGVPGEIGPQGDQGPAGENGVNGIDGENGKDANVAVDVQGLLTGTRGCNKWTVSGFIVNFGITPAENVKICMYWNNDNKNVHINENILVGRLDGHKFAPIQWENKVDGNTVLAWTYTISWDE